MPGEAVAHRNHQIEQTVRQFLATQRTAGLASVDEHGQPHAVNVWYAMADDGLDLVFVSDPASAHAGHIAAGGRIAATIYAEPDDPSQICGVQLHGQCQRIDDPAERSRLLAAYVTRYPFAGQPPLLQQLERQACFVLRPTWLRWIDNRVRFGFKVEASLCEPPR